MNKEERLKTTKGERLIKHLSEKFPVLDHYEVLYRDARLVKIIMNMTDEEFNEITYGSKNYIDGFVIGDGT